MNTAILVIDLQTGLFEEELPFDFDNVIKNVNKITDHARRKKWPVIFVQHEKPDSIVQFDTDGWKLVSELRTESSDSFVRKTTPNSFVKTNLNDLLVQYNIQNLIICGYATEFCVDSTVRGAAALGYSIQIGSDAHTTHDKSHATAQFIRAHHNATLSNIKSFDVPIEALTTKEIINL